MYVQAEWGCPKPGIDDLQSSLTYLERSRRAGVVPNEMLQLIANRGLHITDST